MKTCKVAYIVGSLAEASINHRLALALVRLAPKELELSEIPIRHLPLYSQDYDAALIGEEKVQGILCYVLSLKAKSKKVTYDKIVYYIAKESNLGLKAEYYTLSGKHYKTAYLEYNNVFENDGERFNFVSRMEILDEFNNDQNTILTYTDIESRKIPSSRFNKTQLMRN